ncbi:hypothetical protein MLD63_06745 [Paracoccus sp. TK19116]|uniref:Uncharacterized protein n=1 Tax=Paracoccus albicereus TaxID=2922394 RepID=A0ABT1MPB2_9RHOB|nr:hypothetical protein [Paracoccus albicereus]MCQ0970122.1 hypothetical protein [Paracoccus albicereus]
MRLSRASGGRLIRSIVEDLTRTPIIRMTHKTAAGVPIEITITAQPGITHAALLCRVGDDDHMYLRVSQPAAITRQVTGFRTGNEALQLLTLLEDLRIDPT